MCLPGSGGRWGREELFSRGKFLLEGDESILELDRRGDCTTS